MQLALKRWRTPSKKEREGELADEAGLPRIERFAEWLAAYQGSLERLCQEASGERPESPNDSKAAAGLRRSS